MTFERQKPDASSKDHASDTNTKTPDAIIAQAREIATRFPENHVIKGISRDMEYAISKHATKQSEIHRSHAYALAQLLLDLGKTKPIKKKERQTPPPILEKKSKPTKTPDSSVDSSPQTLPKNLKPAKDLPPRVVEHFNSLIPNTKLHLGDTYQFTWQGKEYYGIVQTHYHTREEHERAEAKRRAGEKTYKAPLGHHLGISVFVPRGPHP